MRINEVADLQVNEDGNTYRQSVLTEMEVAYDTNWDEIDGVELNEDYFKQAEDGTINPWD